MSDTSGSAGAATALSGLQEPYGYASGSKRAADFDGDLEQSASKMLRAAGGGSGTDEKPFRGKGWSCPRCGNVNHDGRQTCNMRNCGEVRPLRDGEWRCICGNINYATRTECGLRWCTQTRPGVESFTDAFTALAMSPAQSMPASASDAVPTDPLAQLLNALGAANSYHGAITAPTATPVSIENGASTRLPSASGPQTPKAPPEGSWRCLGCGNVNYPTRDVCNGRSCGRPRSEVDGGRPLEGNQNWVCPICRNVNFPMRLVCNKRGCNQPRPDAQSPDPYLQYMSQQAFDSQAMLVAAQAMQLHQQQEQQQLQL